MAGDQISATTQYYYQQPIGNTGSSNILSNVLNSLLAVLNTSSPNIVHTHLLDINNQLSQDPVFGNIVQPQEGSVGNIPKAYLSVLFFDERFNFIGKSSNQLRVTDADNSNANLTLLNLKAPKNGYAYIYVSNSSDVNVYFDNLKVAHNRGRIVEENHYYAFGLKIAGISSKKLADQTGNEGHTQNEFGYNDKELFDEGDLNWYDYGFRNYDPQIGRFVQIDPLSDDYDALTPYHYAANDPIGNVDIDGLGIGDAIGNTFNAAFTGAGTAAKDLGEVVVSGVRHVSSAASSSLLSIGGSFLKGVGQSALGTLASLGNAVIHPIATVSAIGHAIANPVQTGKALYSAAKNTYNEFKNGDANTRANILGNLTGDIAQAFIGTGEAKAAAYALEASKYERALIKFYKSANQLRAAATEGSEAAGVLSKSELLRIENAATRIKKQINVVGSRASGKAGAFSDWDYVIGGLNNREWKKIKNSLPGSRSVMDNVPRNIDIFKGRVNPNLPHITINPR